MVASTCAAFFSISVMPTTTWKFDRFMPRSRRNVSMPRSQLPGSPRSSSCIAFGPSMLMVVIRRPTPRLSTFSTSATVLSPNQPVVGKFSRNSDLQLVWIAATSSSRSRRMKSSPPVMWTQRNCGQRVKNWATSAGVISFTLFFSQMLHISHRKLQ